jgi:hypothetical protein
MTIKNLACRRKDGEGETANTGGTGRPMLRTLNIERLEGNLVELFGGGSVGFLVASRAGQGLLL